MELLKFDKNVDVIAQLGDQPNLENGLSAQELKAKFDQAANLIKEYLNAQVAPAVNEKLPAAELPTAIDAALAQAKASGAFDGVSVTHEWNGTALKVTSASGTSSADLRGAKGDKGDTGDKGDKGDTGRSGNDGADGRSVYYCSSTDVFAGSPHNYSTPMSSITGVADSAVNSGDIMINAAGTLGVVSSVQNGVVTVYAVASIKGDDGATGEKGEPGKDGTPGAPGKDGAQGPKGDKGDTGKDGKAGEAGYTPIKGLDYFDGISIYHSTRLMPNVAVGDIRAIPYDSILANGRKVVGGDSIITPDGFLWRSDLDAAISSGTVQAVCVACLNGYGIYYTIENGTHEVEDGFDVWIYNKANVETSTEVRVEMRVGDFLIDGLCQLMQVQSVLTDTLVCKKLGDLTGVNGAPGVGIKAITIEEVGTVLISFTIDGWGTYQAKEGMTWAEWIESEYNTIGAEADGKDVIFPDDPDWNSTWYVLDEDGNSVTPDDVIAADYTYLVE